MLFVLDSSDLAIERFIRDLQDATRTDSPTLARHVDGP